MSKQAKDICGCPRCGQVLHVPELAEYDSLLAAAREAERAVTALKFHRDENGVVTVVSDKESLDCVVEALARLREHMA